MAADIVFDHFYRYAELGSLLDAAAAEAGEWMTRESLVKTPEGRDVWLVTLTDPATGAADDKPAYYVQGGIHAQEAAGTTAVMHLLLTLIRDEQARRRLRDIAFYLVPRVNPDGMEYALTTRAPIRSRLEPNDRRNALIPKDMNGDGRILSMRWEDPAGAYRVDPVDPRLMILREPGDAGPFYTMVSEGIIRDYDGTEIAPGMRTVDMNRNYAANWKPISVAADYPFSEPEVRAVGEFTLRHRNIFAGVDFHCGTNAILRLTAGSDADLNQSDLELTLRLGRLAETVTGLPLLSLNEYGDTWRKKTLLPGSSNQWAYHRLGISHYVVELGNGFNSAGITAREYFQADARTRSVEFMRRVLQCHDEHDSDIFVPWQPFDHPQLGRVDIGGILQGNAYFMVPDCMASVIPRTTSFVLRHAAFHPHLILSDLRVDGCGGDVYRVRATVANIGGLGTIVMQGGSPDTRDPVRLALQLPDNVSLLSRSPVKEFASLAPTGGKGFAEWFVKAAPGAQVTVRASHPKGGVAETSLELS